LRVQWHGTKSNNGLGCADLAIATRAYEQAKQKGRGITIDLPAPGEKQILLSGFSLLRLVP